VFLLEWQPPSHITGNYGFAECTQAISDCVASLSYAADSLRPFVIGHSLGGTLAAIYSAFSPESIRGLVLLGAPLCFQAQTSQFRDALISLIPSELSGVEPFPGSLLSFLSATASPRTFLWSRLSDAAQKAADPRAMDIHMRVERWALDEVPLSGRLVHELIDWLYRENRFCRGTLQIRERRIGPMTASAPMLAVMNTADDIVPLASVKPFVDEMSGTKALIIEYPGELGTCLQHLAILIGRQAHECVWPQIICWLNSQA
jgi:polyhydroxyalkanoate synthase